MGINKDVTGNMEKSHFESHKDCAVTSDSDFNTLRYYVNFLENTWISHLFILSFNYQNMH